MTETSFQGGDEFFSQIICLIQRSNQHDRHPAEEGDSGGQAGHPGYHEGGEPLGGDGLPPLRPPQLAHGGGGREHQQGLGELEGGKH